MDIRDSFGQVSGILFCTYSSQLKSKSSFKRKKGSNRVEIQEFSTWKREPRVWDGENFETSNMKTSSVIKNQVQNSFRSCFYLFSKRENGISFTEPISKNFRISPNLPSRIFVHQKGFSTCFSLRACRRYLIIFGSGPDRRDNRYVTLFRREI